MKDILDNTDVNAGGAKFDTGKVRIDLVPGEFIYAVAAVLTYGAIKYDDWNWAKGLRKGRIMAAMGRHWIAYMMGIELDDESGLPHTWHMATCLAMLISSEARGVAEEDRVEAVEAYHRVQAQFANMQDPKGTEKNGGGALVEEEENEWLREFDRVIDEIIEERVYDCAYGETAELIIIDDLDDLDAPASDDLYEVADLEAEDERNEAMEEDLAFPFPFPTGTFVSWGQSMLAYEIAGYKDGFPLFTRNTFNPLTGKFSTTPVRPNPAKGTLFKEVPVPFETEE